MSQPGTASSLFHCCCRCLDLFACIGDVLRHALQGSERSSSTRENFHHEGFRSDEGGTAHRDTRNKPGGSHTARGEEPARTREHGRRRSRRQTGDAKVDGGKDRSRSAEDIYDVEEVDVGWEGSGSGPASSPSRGRTGRVRRSVPSNANGHDRPTPSYALPTKHFKTIDRWGERSASSRHRHRRSIDSTSLVPSGQSINRQPLVRHSEVCQLRASSCS